MGKEVERRVKKEGTCVCLWLIHVDIWQKSSQYCKVIILRLKIQLKQNLKDMCFFFKESIVGKVRIVI